MEQAIDTGFREENYIMVREFMIKDLKLSGNELLAYAYIYGFSVNKNGVYFGSIDSLSEIINVSRRTVINVLQSLTKKGYLEKTSYVKNGVNRVEYSANRVVQNLHSGSAKSALGSAKSAPNNISYNKSYNKRDNKDEDEERASALPTSSSTYQKIDSQSEISLTDDFRPEWLQESSQLAAAKIRSDMSDKVSKSVETLQERYMDHEIIVEQMCMSYSMDKGRLEDWLQAFVRHKIRTGNITDSWKNFCSHFNSWLSLQDLDKQPKDLTTNGNSNKNTTKNGYKDYSNLKRELGISL